MERVRNVEVLQRLNELRSLERCIEWRQKNWIGHTLRGEASLREDFEGRFEGRIVRGRRRRGLLDGLKIGGNYVNLKRLAKDRINMEELMKKTCQKGRMSMMMTNSR